MHWVMPAGTEGHQRGSREETVWGYAPLRHSRVRFVPDKNIPHLAIYLPNIQVYLTHQYDILTISE